MLKEYAICQPCCDKDVFVYVFPVKAFGRVRLR